jgi:Bacterial protein of unknown function (DUF899)
LQNSSIMSSASNPNREWITLAVLDARSAGVVAEGVSRSPATAIREAVACYQGDGNPAAFRLGALNVTLRGGQIRVHREHHDVAMTAVSRAPIEKARAYKRRNGVDVPSGRRGGVQLPADPRASASWRGCGGPRGERLRPRGRRRLPPNSIYARGSDALWGTDQWLDPAPLGRNESDRWYRRRDEYADDA